MSNCSDPTPNSGDDSGEVLWDERDWREYVLRAQAETSQFSTHYRSIPLGPNRLDETARLMGWETTEEANPDIPDSEDTADVEPYTALRHPVTIASRSLTNQLLETFAQLVASNRASAAVAWNFANHLRLAERETLMALHSLDEGDYGLASCHLKEALSHINHIFGILGGEEPVVHDEEEAVFLNCRRVLFDFREILLRVLRDSRTELGRKRHPEG